MDARDEQGLKAIDEFYEEIVEIYPKLRDVVGLRAALSNPLGILDVAGVGTLQGRRAEVGVVPCVRMPTAGSTSPLSMSSCSNS